MTAWQIAIAVAIHVVAGLVAYWAGYVGATRAQQRKLQCPCQHSISFHENFAGHCHGRREVAVYIRGVSAGTKEVDCDCQHYAGPPPPPEMVIRF